MVSMMFIDIMCATASDEVLTDSGKDNSDGDIEY